MTFKQFFDISLARNIEKILAIQQNKIYYASKAF